MVGLSDGRWPMPVVGLSDGDGDADADADADADGDADADADGDGSQQYRFLLFIQPYAERRRRRISKESKMAFATQR